MRFRYLLPFALLAGCSSQPDEAALKADPKVNQTAQQALEKNQSDPNVPDGLKKIQADTLQRQPGMNR